MPFPRTGIIIMREDSNTLLNAPSSVSAPTFQPDIPTNNGGILSSPTSITSALTNSIIFSNQNVLYFKINLEETKTNMYGESLEKWYYPSSKVPCLIERGSTINSDDDFGVNISQNITLSISQDITNHYNFIPQVGDIISDRERYYEVNNVDSQFATLSGANPSNGEQGTTGQILMYAVTCYLTRLTKLNLIEYYQ